MSELATIPNTNGLARLPAFVPNRSLNMVQIMSDRDTFAQIKEAAKMFATSSLVPEHLRGPQRVGDLMIAMAIAFELGENPLIVMQSIYFVSGKAGWAATYMIGRANKSGVFKGNINWRETGEGENLVVTAYAKKADTGEEVSIDASMKMANAEGWTRNAKYKSMPKLMLRYRSATMLIRLYAPEVMLGSTFDEIEDMHHAGPNADNFPDIPAGSLSEIIDAPEVAAAIEQAEPPALPEPESLGDIMQADQPRPRDVSTWPLFKGAMESHAKSINADIEKFDKLMGWIGLSSPDVKKDNNLGKASRESFYRDFLAGKPINGVTFGGANV